MKKISILIIIFVVLFITILQPFSYGAEAIDGVIKTQSDIDIYQYMKTQTEMEHV